MPEEEVARVRAALHTDTGSRDDLGHEVIVDERSVMRRPRKGRIRAWVDGVSLCLRERGRDGIVWGGRELYTLYEGVTWVFVNAVVVHGDRSSQFREEAKPAGRVATPKYETDVNNQPL